MKSFRIFFAVIIAVIIGAFAVTNITLSSYSGNTSGRPYRVEASRAEQAILRGEEVDLQELEYITGIEKLDSDSEADFYESDSDYIIKEIQGEVYRFDYTCTENNADLLLYSNLLLGAISLAVLLIMAYVYFAVIKPFHRLREMPFELAKGNLTMPLKENRHTYFGRFIWGMDNLREHLENQKAREIQLQKEKKTLVLSLSHDIKTPLSVIELYAKALKKGLYEEEGKRQEIASAISDKCSDIKGYVDSIIKASNEDFLNLEVKNEGFYLSSLVRSVQEFYTEKLSLLSTDFTVEKYTDVLLKGDLDRSVEAVQNIIENAIKYGDGRNITLSFAEEDGAVLFSVSNSGSALSDTELTHIFDSFWRGSNAGSQSGSGLGLYICRQLMFKMGGDIFAKSKDGEMKVTLVFAME